MKTVLSIAIPLIMLLAGCMKHDQGCTTLKPQDEEKQILAYANDNGITATKHLSGLYYEIMDAGYGVTPTVNSKVTVDYMGKLLDGTTFDQNTRYSEQLTKLIEGWQLGIPLIKKGGRIKLIIPSSLAYGCNGSGTAIPANSVLYFDIKLNDVR